MKRPHSLTEVAQEVSSGTSNFSMSLADFLDYFYTLKSSEDQMNALKEEPALLHQGEEDAYLAAAAEHLSRANELPIPEWTQGAERFLREPFFDNAGLSSLNATLLVESPISFRRRFIFTEKRPMRRV